MTFLAKRFFDPFGMEAKLLNDFFNEPTFTRRITLDHKVLADKNNYQIFELPNGNFEVRVKYSDDTTTYHRASTKTSLDEAITYVDDQIKYHSRRLEGPKLVWDGSKQLDAKEDDDDKKD